MKHVKGILSAALLVAMSFSSQAELVQTSFAEKVTVTDTVSGVEWLKLSYSANKSYTQVRSELSTTYAGYRFATNAEVEELFKNQFPKVWDTTASGYGKTSSVSNNTIYNQIYKFNNLFNATKPSFGFYYDEDSVLRMAGGQYNSATGHLYGTEFLSVQAEELAYSNYGTYLVRAKPGDSLYSINDPLYRPSENDDPSNDVPAPFAPLLAALPLLFTWRRRA